MNHKEIGVFKRYTKRNNEIHFGYLYTAELHFETKNEEKTRTVRVWLPKDYFKTEQRYPVMYMSDGQNMVDAKTSAFGEWNMEDHITNLMKKGYEGMILVGIDCPIVEMNRMGELCPPYTPERAQNLIPYGDVYGKFVFDVVKPLVDRLFRTKPDKLNTGVGGSSMGGIMSFYLGCLYKKQVGFSLCFSPAFFLYHQSTLRKSLSEWNADPKEYGKFFMFTGAQGFERVFPKSTELVYKAMAKKGFDKDQVCFLMDSRMKHHESSWSYYVEEALLYLYYNQDRNE